MKKFLALILAVLMLGSILAACGGGDSKGGSGSSGGSSGGGDDDAPFYGEDNISLRVWAPDKAIDLTKELCDEFIAKYPDKKISIDVQVQTEAEAATQVLNDKDAAADVFGFVSDQFTKLMNANALAYVFEPDEIEDRNSDNSVKAATADGKLYAFPETDDNGYYFVYDTSVISEEQAKTLEGVLEACKAAGRKFIMDAGNGYYSCIFPFTGGMTLEGLDENGVQQFGGLDDKNIDHVVDTMYAFADLFHKYKDVFLSSEVAKIPTGMSANPRLVAAGIDGSWDLVAIKKALGDDFGVSVLPTIDVNGTPEPMRSLHGYKLVGVNTATQFPNAAQALADFLTNEDSQLKRAEVLQWGPSNRNAQNDPIVQDNAAIKAILDQSLNAELQVNMSDTFWTPMGTLGNSLWKESDYSKETIRKNLDKTIASIKDE